MIGAWDKRSANEGPFSDGKSGSACGREGSGDASKERIPFQGCRCEFPTISTGIRRTGAKKIDPQGEEQFRTTTRGMRATAKKAQAVESFDGQGQ